MSKITFNKVHSRVRQGPEIHNGEYLVEKGGYRSTKKQIEEFFHAGKRLATHRQMVYDQEFEDGFIPERMDITREPNFDPADAFQYAAELELKAQEIKEAAELAAKQKEDTDVDDPKGDLEVRQTNPDNNISRKNNKAGGQIDPASGVSVDADE